MLLYVCARSSLQRPPLRSDTCLHNRNSPCTPRFAQPKAEFNNPIDLDPTLHEGRFGSGTINREFMAVRSPFATPGWEGRQKRQTSAPLFAHGGPCPSRPSQAGSCKAPGDSIRDHGCYRKALFLSPQPVISCGAYWRLRKYLPSRHGPLCKRPMSLTLRHSLCSGISDENATLYPEDRGCNGGNALEALCAPHAPVARPPHPPRHNAHERPTRPPGGRRPVPSHLPSAGASTGPRVPRPWAPRVRTGARRTRRGTA